MKQFAKILGAALLLASATSGIALAQTGHADYAIDTTLAGSRPVIGPDKIAAAARQDRLLKRWQVHVEAVRAADGGALTPQHHDQLLSELKALSRSHNTRLAVQP